MLWNAGRCAQLRTGDGEGEFTVNLWSTMSADWSGTDGPTVVVALF